MTISPIERIVVNLGTQWEQAVFVSTNIAYWQDSWRHRCLFHAVRILGRGTLLHAFLVPLSAGLLIGRWFAGTAKSLYVVSLSHNNDRAFAELNAQLALSDVPVFQINRARLPIWRRLAVLCSGGNLLQAGRVLGLHGSSDPHVRAQQVFGVACGLMFLDDLQRSGARTIAVANDHSPPTLALLIAGDSLGIPRIYVQHARVTRHFPPLDVEIAILRDTQTAEAYREAAVRMGHPWRPDICHICDTPAPPPAQTPSFGTDLAICIALSMYPDLPQVAKFVHGLRQAGVAPVIALRPHPRYPHCLARFAAQLGISLQPAKGDLDRLVHETDLFVVSNSSLALDLLQRGAPTVFADALDHQHRDYFGLVAAGLLPEMEAETVADPRVLSDRFTPDWQNLVRETLAGKGGDDDLTLAARIRPLLPTPLILPEDIRISVVIPAYNRARTLLEAIRSARAQSLRPYEIIVVDDGSDDGTAEMLQHYFPDVILVRLPGRRGACAARNAGITAASGSHIAFLDSDDSWLPEKLALQIIAMRKVGARFATCGKVTSSGRTALTRQLADRRLTTFNFRGGTSGLVAETDLLRGVRFDPAMPAAQDWDIFLRLSDVAKGVHVPQALYVYGTSETNRITRSKRRRFLGHVRLYRQRIRGTPRDTLRAWGTHRAIQAMLVAELRNRKLCRIAADAVHRLLR